MKLNLWGDNDEALNVSAGNAESMNCYLVPSKSGRNPFYLTGVMGSRLHATLGPTLAATRGAHVLDNAGYAVAFNSLFKIDLDGVVTDLGAIPGSDQVSMVDDGTSVIVFNGTNIAYYYNTATEVFSTVSMPFTGYTAVYIDTYIMVTSDNQVFFRSDVGDSASFNALNFSSADKTPDDLLAVTETHGELLLMGETTSEFWFNQGGADFAFARSPGAVMEKGIYGRFGFTSVDNSIYFLGNDLIVYRIEGYNPIRVSNEDLEIKLSNLRNQGYQSDLQNVIMFSYVEHGHTFLQVNIPNRLTVTYNLVTNEWFTSKHFDYETSIASHYMNINSRHFIGALDGKVYEWSRNFYDDDGRPLKRGRKSQFFSNDDRIMSWKKIKFVANFGETPLINGEQGSDPKMVLRWSDDNGRTFKNEKFLTLGRAGDYTAKSIKRACGASRNRQIEFYVTDPVPFILIDALADIT